MSGIESKKAALLHIYDILRENTDTDHPLQQEEIAEILYHEYGIGLERKAVSRNIDLLIDAGYDIEKGRRGCYLATREFEDNEIRFLIDLVLSNRHISEKYSKDLIEKLCRLSNKYFRLHTKHIHTVKEWNKIENPAMFCNLEMIDEAMAKKRKLRFTLNSYGIDKKLHAGQEHLVSPIRILMKNQCYYLLAVEKCEDMDLEFETEPIARLFQIDMITDMEITDVKADSHVLESASYEQILREHPEMESFLFDEVEPITFVCPEKLIDRVIATFGKSISIEKVPPLAPEENFDMPWFNGYRDKFIQFTVRTSHYSAQQFVRRHEPYTFVLKPDKLKRNLQRRLAERYAFARRIEGKIADAKGNEKKG